MSVGSLALRAIVRLVGDVADPVFVQGRAVLELLVALVARHMTDGAQGRRLRNAVRIHQVAFQHTRRLLHLAADLTGQIGD